MACVIPNASPFAVPGTDRQLTAADKAARIHVRHPQHRCRHMIDGLQMIKGTLLLTLILVSGAASSATVFDGYPAYYSGLERTLFKENSSTKFKGMKNQSLYWEGHRFRLNQATIFANETATDEDLGLDPRAYKYASYGCAEGIVASASGTAGRHQSVYLIDMSNHRKPKLYKLPSLFASCLGIRFDSQKRVAFDKASYTYDAGADRPSGVAFQEYVIDQGNFQPAGRTVRLRFTEPDNVYKFSIESSTPKQ